MSRIGNQPVVVPKEVTASIAGDTVVVKGTKGELTVAIPDGVSLAYVDQTILVARSRDDGASRAIHGFARAELHNAITGVTAGWTKSLELSGVGYRAALQGASLVLTVGFSHPVTIAPPAGITFTVTEGKINVSGVDRQLVGQVAASIRAVKVPEPYKGKGIKYVGEYIRKKAGKSAKAVGGAPGAK